MATMSLPCSDDSSSSSDMNHWLPSRDEVIAPLGTESLGCQADLSTTIQATLKLRMEVFGVMPMRSGCDN